MRYVLIKAGKVINVIELEPTAVYVPDDGQIIFPSDTAASGDSWDGTTFTRAAPPPSPVPTDITDRQFFQAAAQIGMITKPEALAMMSSGAMPMSLANALKSLPPDDLFAVQMKIVGIKQFQRTDPFLVELATAMGVTPSQVDDLFRLGSTL